MNKRLISFILVMVLMFGQLSYSVFAAEEPVDTQIISFEDGSYIEVSVIESSARVANTVSGSKKYTFYDGNNNKSWEAKLTATFAYSGGWYTCTTANCNVTIYDSQWYVISNSTVRSSNNAVTNLTMGLRTAGVTIERPQYTIKLTCDINGNLS